jgi:hypothetical protein
MEEFTIEDDENISKIESERRVESGNMIISYYLKIEYNPDTDFYKDWNALIPVWVKLTNDDENIKHRIEFYQHSKHCLIEGDVTHLWSRIVAYINSYILSEDEYKKCFIHNYGEYGEKLYDKHQNNIKVIDNCIKIINYEKHNRI